MQRPPNYPTPQYGWGSTASATPTRLRPFAEIADVEADLDEIAARNGEAPNGEPIDQQPSAVAAINEGAVWANYNKGKGTPLSAHTLK